MSPSTSQPRADQIALLTQGLLLPHDRLHGLHLSFIAEILAKTWDKLFTTYPDLATSGDEAAVNAAMETLLNIRLAQDELWAQLARNVTRGTEMISFDGTHLEKRPDLSVHLTSRNTSFPLVVECKLIDHPLRKSIAKYCNEGIVRFVTGEYSWAVQEAFMLAYVRDASTIDSKLTPFLDQARRQPPDPYQTVALPVTLSVDPSAAETKHARNFAYVGQSTSQSPGEIAIWHIWLSAPNHPIASDQSHTKSDEG